MSPAVNSADRLHDRRRDDPRVREHHLDEIDPGGERRVVFRRAGLQRCQRGAESRLFRHGSLQPIRRGYQHHPRPSIGLRAIPTAGAGIEVIGLPIDQRTRDAHSVLRTARRSRVPIKPRLAVSSARLHNRGPGGELKSQRTKRGDSGRDWRWRGSDRRDWPERHNDSMNYRGSMVAYSVGLFGGSLRNSR